jgi:UDP-N-acetylmuramoylalanine--D-glutamate ligase
MSNFASEVEGKKVLIFGLGRQGGGTGDAQWLKQHGAIVRISDKDPSLSPEGQTKEHIDWAEIIIKNPAVPDDHELILYAKSLHKPVYTSIALFVKYANLPIIGVTGTRGKSTTVALITAVLNAYYPGQVISGGNIAGTSGLALFDQLEGKRYAVLELSSFQLHNFHDLQVSPPIAVVTNLYPDHLNRYPTMIEYQADKESICRYQSKDDLCIFNQDNAGAVAIASVSPARLVPFSSRDASGWSTKLPGQHNRENIGAVAVLVKTLNLDESIAKDVVAGFAGLTSRQETVAVKEGIAYVNDTTATTPTAAIKALEAATTPLVWITGGDTKKLPYEDLITAVKTNPYLKKIVILGSKNIPDYISDLHNAASDKIVGTATSMLEAVQLAKSVASPGDTVLLSPGFTSFDLFKNEFDRGNQFNDIVKKL